MKKRLVSCIIVPLLFLFACKTTDSGITTKLNGTFTLSLEGNATTGYQWTFINLDKQDLVELDHDEYIQRLNPTTMVGTGGIHTFTFKAVKRGTVNLSAQYARSWETEPTPQTKQFTITIQ